MRQRGEVLCSHQSFIKSAEWRIFCCGIRCKGARTRRVARQAVRQRGEVLCSHQSFIKSAEWRIFCCTLKQRGENPQGNIPSSSSSGGVARVSVPGWSNPHRPQFGQHTPVTRTHQCPPPHTGPRENAIFVGGYLWGRGVSCFARRGVGLIRAPLVIAKECDQR